jgi:putative ABC transport system ATP-binding protein
MTEIVTCHSISKTYQSGDLAVDALSDIDLAVAEGEFACLVGPSGSGKTTLLNIIGGLDQPTRGEVQLRGRRIDTLPPGDKADLRLRQIGFVFQAYNLIPVLTARENVELIMELQGVSTTERARRSTETLRAVGLDGLADRRPGELSGGQQQRVAVARAIVSQPPRSSSQTSPPPISTRRPPRASSS